MSDSLVEKLWIEHKPRKSDDPDERVRQALKKALDNTTPEHAGSPWDKEEEELNESRRGWHLPGGRD